MKKIVVMASGEGSNFSAIVNSGIKVDRVITDNSTANVIKRAEDVKVPVIIIDKSLEYHGMRRANEIRGGQENSSVMFEDKILKAIPKDTDLIVLAGYGRILTSYFCGEWKDKIINIHPSLLPSFAGTIHAIKQSWEHGCKVFGITIHYVTEEVDAGSIISQQAIHKFDEDTLEDIIHKIHKMEHKYYPKTIKKLMKI
jgi:phosphoribosylglycinamide formyltransferase-1